MGLPPASPRFKFVHTHPGGGGGGGNLAIPRRPPRQQPPSPSVRSRSLELLDQDEEEERKSVSAVVVQARPPLPRPRSRSLDGLLDEDAKSGGESCEQDKQKSRGHLARNSEGEEKIVFTPETAESRNSNVIETTASEDDPVPLPRMKPKSVTECKSEAEDARTFSGDKDETEKEIPPTRPPKPIRRSSSEGQSSTTSSKQCEEQEQHLMEEQRRAGKSTQGGRLRTGNNENEDDDDEDHDDRSTMLKTRSCGAGLDSDGSISSSEYGDRSRGPKQGPGSLLSLPAGAEPKRKRNFMDKCVNKVRSFMKK